HHRTCPAGQRCRGHVGPAGRGSPALTCSGARAAIRRCRPGTLAGVESPSPTALSVATHVRTRAAALPDDLIGFRRDIHAHPELSRAEHRTTAALAARLRAAGLGVDPMEQSGLTCDIRAQPDGPTRPMVALRADVDALPLTETSGLDFASTVPGVAHACGHDVHTAVVLGAGLILAEMAAHGSLASDVRLIFQPAEEVHPGGALDTIRAGRLAGVEQIFALHCDPTLD